MSDIKILIEVTRDQQIEVEDYCFREGMTISQYFMGLHEGQKRKLSSRNEETQKEEKPKKGKKSKKPEQYEMDMNKK